MASRGDEVVPHRLQRVDHQTQVVHAFAQHLGDLLLVHIALLDGHQGREQGRAEAVVHVGHQALAFDQQGLLALGLAQALVLDLVGHPPAHRRLSLQLAVLEHGFLDLAGVAAQHGIEEAQHHHQGGGRHR